MSEFITDLDNKSVKSRVVYGLIRSNYKLHVQEKRKEGITKSKTEKGVSINTKEEGKENRGFESH